MQVRIALATELEEVHRMGFDTWNDGLDLDVYLAGCLSSPKYARGCWYVLADETAGIRSSLIRYSLGNGTCGIGSIATAPAFRGRGFASELIVGALARFEGDGIERVFLFSDIDPAFYERLGFLPLPQRFQRHPGSVCMIRGATLEALEREPGFVPPEYF